MWSPAKIEYILKDIEYCEIIFFNKPDCLKFWNFIKVKPEKWIEKSMGNEGEGFWIVAILGKSVIYYNDIEEGYNLSTFSIFGKIDEYKCSQIELYAMIESLWRDTI